ncbi:hypothetical protein JCM8115_005691 [Rhodotorula mucilaginosa]|uniref:RING-CH-type domain-containing protein n=1 Tax=Rhodotorula mucilaginosa TaxID=5537 RepID=A0A9P6W3Q9_RHOMI|nr:hypothetical protein C6P46_003800 [Rhodotorula mucilaginosa]TKA51891.1 hypothetical protein B0A53_04921 [Rhodotorula sp. CCFEE 5036]
MDAAPQAIHVGASVATPSGAAPTTDTSLRRRRERSVSSDASDAYVEHLLRPDAPRVKPEQSKPAPSVEESDLGAATSDEHVQRQSEEGSAAEAEHGDHGAEGNPQEANAGPGEEKMCRICFDGPDEELGKLFSPCLCRGTSRYVHTACLEQWRKASPNARAFWECQQCGYRYRLQRTALARVVTSPLTVTTLTITFFLLLVYFAGFFANSLLAVAEHRAASSVGMFDDWFVSDHILVGEGIREAVAFVGHQLEESPWAAGRQLQMDRVLGTEDSGASSWFGFGGRGTSARREAAAPVAAPFWIRAIMHFTKGSALVGIVSVFYSFVATTFVTPIGRTLFRALRPAGGRRRGPTSGASISQLVIVTLIIVGIIKSIRQVYRGVKWLSKVVLSRVEDLVIEVGPA